MTASRREQCVLRKNPTESYIHRKYPSGKASKASSAVFNFSAIKRVRFKRRIKTEKAAAVAETTARQTKISVFG